MPDEDEEPQDITVAVFDPTGACCGQMQNRADLIVLAEGFTWALWRDEWVRPADVPNWADL